MKIADITTRTFTYTTNVVRDSEGHTHAGDDHDILRRKGFVELPGRDGEKRDGVRVRYGIENYFVPEGEGMALERPAEGEEITILVAVDEDGDSAIKAVLVSGEMRY